MERRLLYCSVVMPQASTSARYVVEASTNTNERTRKVGVASSSRLDDTATPTRYGLVIGVIGSDGVWVLKRPVTSSMHIASQLLDTWQFLPDSFNVVRAGSSYPCSWCCCIEQSSLLTGDAAA